MNRLLTLSVIAIGSTLVLIVAGIDSPSGPWQRSAGSA